MYVSCYWNSCWLLNPSRDSIFSTSSFLSLIKYIMKLRIGLIWLIESFEDKTISFFTLFVCSKYFYTILLSVRYAIHLLLPILPIKFCRKESFVVSFMTIVFLTTKNNYFYFDEFLHSFFSKRIHKTFFITFQNRNKHVNYNKQ